MFNKTFYLLQAKKALWLASMLGTIAFIIINTTVTVPSLIGYFLGIGIFSILPLLPNTLVALVFLASPVIALTTPYALAFNLGFLGVYAHIIMQPSPMREALKKNHCLGRRIEEQEDLAIMQKLEKKTNITVSHKTVCDIEGKNFSPNAAAIGGLINNTIYIFSNLMQAPFTPKERKAIYAHEFGHLQHWDFLTRITINALWYASLGLSLVSFSLPITIIISTVVSLSYFSIGQIDELLADQYSAQHVNPHALISALNKLQNFEIQKPNDEKSLWNKANSLLNLFKKTTGMITHPDIVIRKAYLLDYAEKKMSAKNCNPNTSLRVL